MNELAPIDVDRGHALAKFDRLSRELARPLPLDRAADVERELSELEDYARSAGLFRPEESLEFRLGRFLARWRLGEALAPMERGAGPGRGKKDVSMETSFRALLKEIRVARKAALQAQRVACLPFEEFGKFCLKARKVLGEIDLDPGLSRDRDESALRARRPQRNGRRLHSPCAPQKGASLAPKWDTQHA